jgi:putative ABC-type dipeptide/oligopeptide transport system
MEKQYIFNRRTLLGGAAATTTVGLLAACGGKKEEEKVKSAGKGAKVEDLYDINAHPVSDLKQGGEVRLPLGSIGPDFNVYSTGGSSSDTYTAMSTLYAAGLWSSLPNGTLELNKDFAVSFDPKEENGKTVVYVAVNPKAKFNDGTPMDYKALQATWQILKSTEGDFKIVTSGIYGSVEKVERDGDDFKVKVTMTSPYYPLNELFASILHPKMADPKVFNDGFVNNPHPEFGCGPFKLADKGWNSTENTFTVVPNEKWWGEKPVLDRIIFRTLEASAERAAFKNGEIDVASARTSTAYAEVKNVANAELRKGQRLFSGGLNLNPKRIEDAKVRKAIFIGTNREALAKIRFQGLPWEEQLPGSRLYLPFEEYYEDNFPKADGDAKAAAQKILEDAGYKKDGEFYAKNGKQLSYKISIFGDDPVNNSMAQTFVQNMKELGINFSVNSRASSEFSKAIPARDYDTTFSGFSLSTADGTSATKQFYYSKDNEGIGSEEIDKMIEKMLVIKDDKERNKKCNEIEKKHMDEISTVGTVFNGPDFMMCKKGLANYGPSLFQTTDWAKVGWLK